MQIVRQRSKRYRLAIAVRNNISEVVSAAVVDANETDVIVSLLNNATAKISETTMAHLVDESRRVDDNRQPLVMRDDLQENLARKMCRWISDELIAFVGAKYQIDISVVEREVRQAAGDLLELDDSAGSPGQQLIDQLDAAGELDVKYLLRFMAQGQIGLFELALARLAGIELDLARKFVYDYGEEGLLVICRAAKLDDHQFLNVHRLVNKARDHSHSPGDPDCQELRARYNNLAVDLAKVIGSRRQGDDDVNLFSRDYTWIIGA